MLEIAKGATEFNIPIIRANRKLVAFEDGGLHNPSALLFNADWGSGQAQELSKRFYYPSLSNIQKPENEEDIAFMSVSWLMTQEKQAELNCITCFIVSLNMYNY